MSSIISEEKFEEIHEYSLKVLEQTGMRFLSEEILNSLEKYGAIIDRVKNIARIPGKLVQEKLDEQIEQIKKGKKQILLNGGVSSRSENKISCKFGSGAFFIFDWEKQEKRRALDTDVENAVIFGHALDDVGAIGVPIISEEINGKKIHPDMLPIYRAMVVAKNTSKVANNEVNTVKQLKYLMEMGSVVRGSMDEYKKNPCFITAKHPVSPLQLDKDACDVLIALARNDLPVTVIPMPIMGTSVPVTILGAMILANAEFLGALTAVKTIVPEAIVMGGSMPASTDMMTGEISYDMPSAIKMNIAMANFYEKYYDFDFGLGVYCSDSKFLGPEIIQERTIQLVATAMLKYFNPPVGLYDQGMVFSPELALIEIDILKYIFDAFHKEVPDDDLDRVLKAIENAGPAGTFLAEGHTMKNFKAIYKSDILKEVVDTVHNKKEKGMFDLANEKYKKIMSELTPYRLPQDKEKEIDSIVDRAHKDILEGNK